MSNIPSATNPDNNPDVAELELAEEAGVCELNALLRRNGKAPLDVDGVALFKAGFSSGAAWASSYWLAKYASMMIVDKAKG